MTSLLGIIEGSSSGGTEDLKKVAEFVSEAVDNSLPYDLTAAADSGSTACVVRGRRTAG